MRSADKRDSGQVYWIIDFASANQKFSREFAVTSPSQTPKQFALSAINEFDSAVNGLKVALGPIDLTPDSPVALTQEQIDQQAFLALVKQYRDVQAAVKAGVGKADQSTLDGILGQIKATFIDSYASFIVGLF